MQENFVKIGIVPKGNYSQQKVKCPKCSHTRKKKADCSLLMMVYTIVITVVGTVL
jgi:hypothetical protein